MKSYIELKLRGDAQADRYTNGLTMCGGQSTLELECINDGEDEKVYRNRKGHELTLKMIKRDGITEYITGFENKGTETAVLEMISSFALSGIKADKIYRLQSFWSAEGRLKPDTVADLQLEPSWAGYGMRVEKFGCVGSMPVRKYFPFIALENSQTHEFIGVQLYSASSWQIELLCCGDETLGLVGGLADRDFGHWFKRVEPGEGFTAPKALIAKGSSLAEVCDKLVKAQQPDISPIDMDMGIVFNEYCTTWGNPSIDNIKKICDRIKGKGFKYFVMDSGWYGNAENWWTMIGDWDVNYTKFPGGLKSMADYVRGCGMIPGIWFEFETVGKGSHYYNDEEHLLKKDGVVLTVGERRFWDMSNPWVVDYLSEKVIRLLKDCGFGYIKADYNDSIGIGCDGAESLGEGLRQRVEAVREFFRRIKSEIPEIVIENCSSGGHRLEPSMLELCSQASFSDAHETLSIPIIAANVQRAVKPSQSQIWAVMRAADSRERIYYSMVNTFFGRMCLSGDIYELSEEQWEQISEGMDFYNGVSDIIRHGITTVSYNNTEYYGHPTGNQLVIREYGDRRLVVAHRFEHSADVDMSFTDGYEVKREYGIIDKDFTAKAWLLCKK